MWKRRIFMAEYRGFIHAMGPELSPEMKAARAEQAMQAAKERDERSRAAQRLLSLAVLGPAVPPIDPSQPEVVEKVNEKHGGEMLAYGEMVTDGLGSQASEDVAYASLVRNLPLMRERMAEHAAHVGSEVSVEMAQAA
jgi:hypothetical protein